MNPEMTSKLKRLASWLVVPLAFVFFFRLGSFDVPEARKCYAMDPASRESFDRALNLSSVLEASLTGGAPLPAEQRSQFERFTIVRARLREAVRTGALIPKGRVHLDESRQIYELIREFYDLGTALLGSPAVMGRDPGAGSASEVGASSKKKVKKGAQPQMPPGLDLKAGTVRFSDLRIQWEKSRKEIYFTNMCR